jgi:crotonobetainyl-CoA hydratase
LTTSDNVVVVERHDHVLLVTINRPEARNAINLAVATRLGDALQDADADPEVRAVVVTGAGDQAFCAGADLKALARGERITPAEGQRAAWGFAGIVRHPIAKPMIAAVNGFALGGGTEITLACDLAIACETAMFGLPEVRRGIIAAAGGAFRLLEQLPPKIAMELLLTGEPIDAARALALGLVNAVVPRDQLLDRAMAMAARIALNAPLAVQASKRIAKGIRGAERPRDDLPWQLTHEEVERVFASDDAKEGPRAFAEKRAPVWTAR